MKAIVRECYGPPSVLHLSDEPVPAAGDGDVLIRVRAVEATKSDCEMRSFRFPVKWFWLPLRIVMGVRKPRRRILGGYFAGEIVAVGNQAPGFEPGDHVFCAHGFKMGAYGAFLAVPAGGTLAKMPSNMSFAEAAAVPLGGLNALHFMRQARIRAGEHVLINGAGGSIGAHAVQIAKAMGAVVTAVDTTHKQHWLTRLGADHVIDYTRRDFTLDSASYDVVFDMVPGSDYSRSVGVLRHGGRYLSGNPRLSVMFRSLVTTLFTDKHASFAFAGERRDELEELSRMIEAGAITSIVDSAMPMESAVEAHQRVETEQRVGAVVIEIDDGEANAAGAGDGEATSRTP